MLGLHVNTELRRIFELVTGVFHNLNSLGISNACKAVFNDIVQFVQQAGFDEFVKQFQIFGAMLHNMSDTAANHILGQIHVVINVGKGHLRLNHPKLGGMARGIGVFGAECGAESIDISQAHGIHFAVELSGNSQVRFLAEKVLRIVNPAVFGTGNIIQVKRSDLKHFAGTLTVGTGNQRRMDVAKTAVMEKLVNGERQFGTNAESGAVFVGTRTQVCNAAQIFVRVLFLLQRKIFVGDVIDFNLVRNDFIFLAAAL